MELKRNLLLVEWRVREGYRMVSLCERFGLTARVIHSEAYQVIPMAIKRRQTDGDMPPIPALSMETVLLKKCPLLMEFIAATAYEDGQPRQPGYYTVRNRGVEYEITLYDPDPGLRLPVRHREHDKCWFLAEALVASPDAPWEVDKYLWGNRPKKTKRKK